MQAFHGHRAREGKRGAPYISIIYTVEVSYF